MARAVATPAPEPDISTKLPAVQETRDLWDIDETAPSEQALADAEADAGRTAPELPIDYVTPRVTIILPGGAQLAVGDPNFIEGAKAGDFLIPHAPPTYFDGARGIHFQPVWDEGQWQEWTPRNSGQGLVTSYEMDEKGNPVGLPKTARAVQEKGYVWYKNEVNEIKDAWFSSGFVHLPGGAVVPGQLTFSGTNLFPHRTWMSQRRLIEYYLGVKRPHFYWLWKFTTKLRRGAGNTWYIFNSSGSTNLFSLKDGAGLKTIEDGRKLHDMFKTGERKIDATAVDAAEATLREATDNNIPF